MSTQLMGMEFRCFNGSRFSSWVGIFQYWQIVILDVSSLPAPHNNRKRSIRTCSHLAAKVMMMVMVMTTIVEG